MRHPIACAANGFDAMNPNLKPYKTLNRALLKNEVLGMKWPTHLSGAAALGQFDQGLLRSNGLRSATLLVRMQLFVTAA